MKKLFFGVILVITLVGAAPFVSGYKAEHALDQWVDYLNTAGVYEASWDYYNKSWLTTDAVLLIKLKKPFDLPLGEGLGQDWVLPLHLNMNHGPLLIKDNFRQGWFSGRLFLSQEHEGWIKDHVQVGGEGPFYTSNLYMDLKGGIHINDHSLPFTITDNGDTLSVEGYIGSGTMTLNQHIDYSGLLPTIVVSGENGTISIENMNFNLSSNLSKKYGKYLAPGKGSFSLSSVKADFSNEFSFILKDAFAMTNIIFNEGGEDASFSVDLGFKEFLSKDEAVKDAKFSMVFERLSLSFLDKYLDMIQQFGALGAESTSLMAMQMSQLAASDLLPFGPKLSVSSLDFTTEEGHLSFSGDVEVSPDAATKMSNPFAIISDVTVNASVELDKALAQRMAKKSTLLEINNQLLRSGDIMTEDEISQMAEQQATMQLSMLVIQGMLVDQDPKYVSKFQFKDGGAILNGQSIPLPF